VAWRTEQPDAVMGSGPVVASRCQRLAKRRATRRLPSSVGQDTILSHMKAAGHPAAFRVMALPLGSGSAGRFGNGVGAGPPLEAQPAGARMAHVAQGDAVAVAQKAALAR
jgi:hypothetical protein